jgi:hypothetical protein
MKYSGKLTVQINIDDVNSKYLTFLLYPISSTQKKLQMLLISKDLKL